MNRRILLISAAVVIGLTVMSSTSLVKRARGQSILIGAERVPNIAVDKNNFLYLTMAVATLPSSAHTPGSQIFFTMSTDGGAQWNNEPLTRNLTNTAINGIGALNPRLAITQTGTTRAYLGYDDDTNSFRQAYFIRSKKNAKFQRPILLSEPGEGGFSPQVAVDSKGIVYAVWQVSGSGGQQVALAASTDFGVTFSPRVILSGSSTTAESPAIATDKNDTIHVAWQDSSTGTAATMYSNSTDGGSTFATPVQLSGVGNATTPQVGLDKSGGLNVVWVQQQEDGSTEVAISRSTDGGSTFTPAATVTNFRNGNVNQLAIASSGSTTYVAFGATSQVFLIQAPSSSLSFQAPVKVSNANPSKGEARSPSIVADRNGKLHIVWIDTSIEGDEEGLLLYSNTTNGRNFSRPVEILAVLQAPLSVS